jgi:hypothetical protein
MPVAFGEYNFLRFSRNILHEPWHFCCERFYDEKIPTFDFLKKIETTMTSKKLHD